MILGHMLHSYLSTEYNCLDNDSCPCYKGHKSTLIKNVDYDCLKFNKLLILNY